MLNTIATFVGLVADLIAIITAFKSDSDNNLTITNYESRVVEIREEYRASYGSSTTDGESIINIVFIAIVVLFGLSVGLYCYLFVGTYLFGIYSILLLLAVVRLKRFDYPVLLYVIQTSTYILILTRRFFTTRSLTDFFNTFSSLDINTTDGTTLGRNIRVIWNALLEKLRSEIVIDRMTVVVTIIIIILFWGVVAKLLKNIIFPKRFKPQTFKSFIVYLVILLLLLNLNNHLIIDLVSNLFSNISDFIKSFFEGFSSNN